MVRGMLSHATCSGAMNGFPLFRKATEISRSGSVHPRMLVKPRCP